MTRIFLIERLHVGEDNRGYFSKAVAIPISPTTDDIIRGYLEMKLDEDTNPGVMNDDLPADIIGDILGKTSDIFLLVSLNIDATLREVTICHRTKKREGVIMSNGLRDAYAVALTRLMVQKGTKSKLLEINGLTGARTIPNDDNGTKRR